MGATPAGVELTITGQGWTVTTFGLGAVTITVPPEGYLPEEEVARLRDALSLALLDIPRIRAVACDICRQGLVHARPESVAP